MHFTENKLSSDLTLVFRALPGLYLLLSPDFVIQDATTSFAKAIHTSIEGIIGKNFFDVFPERSNKPNLISGQELHASLRHVIAHKEPHKIPFIRFDVPLHEASGGSFEERFWETTNTPILDCTGDVLYILHEVKDITETALLEQHHQENEERLAMLNNALLTVPWEYDIVNDRLKWDQKLFQVFGFKPEEMESGGTSWDNLVHPDDFSKVQQSIAQATSQGQKFWTGEYRFKKADGTYSHVLDQGYFVYDSNGNPARTFGTIIDLSQSKRAEAELKESDARFRQLLEHLPHMAGMADHKGKVLYFNDNWYNYTGMAKGQTEGWASFIHPEDTADVLTTWHEAIYTGNMYEIEYRLRDCITGSYRYFMERGVPMHDQQGNVMLWVATLTDIDDQKQTLEKIRQKDQQLESILQLSPSHLCLLEGRHHICRYVSPGVYRIYGNRHYLGRPASAIWPELEQMGFLDLLSQVYQSGTSAQLSEIPVMYDRFQNGKPKKAFFNFKYQPVFTKHGQVEGVLITATEVTELVQTKRKAEALAQELKQKPA